MNGTEIHILKKKTKTKSNKTNTPPQIKKKLNEINKI